MKSSTFQTRRYILRYRSPDAAKGVAQSTGQIWCASEFVYMYVDIDFS